MTKSLRIIAQTIRHDGFAFVQSAEMAPLLRQAGLAGWHSFASSWDDLGVDRYMADNGRYRRRRFAAFRATPAGISRKLHQPHYQSRDYNPLNGGVERWFDPVAPEVGVHAALGAILHLSQNLFSRMTPVKVRPESWHVEMHQFRIEAEADRQGYPTPEGIHRDGVDWVLVAMVRRKNVASGETRIHDRTKRPLGSFTLASPLDCVFVNDNQVYHCVTPVVALDPHCAAYRDVLVVTFRRG